MSSVIAYPTSASSSSSAAPATTMLPTLLPLVTTSLTRPLSPTTSEDSLTSPVAPSALPTTARKVPNTFMMYKNDFPSRYPEVCTLEKTPSQRMRIAARLWEMESDAVRDEYESRYRAALIASGVKGAEADATRRKARSEGVTAARRAKRASEGAVLSPRSELIVQSFGAGLRGAQLVAVVRDWDLANAPELDPTLGPVISGSQVVSLTRRSSSSSGSRKLRSPIARAAAALPYPNTPFTAHHGANAMPTSYVPTAFRDVPAPPPVETYAPLSVYADQPNNVQSYPLPAPAIAYSYTPSYGVPQVAFAQPTYSAHEVQADYQYASPTLQYASPTLEYAYPEVEYGFSSSTTTTTTYDNSQYDIPQPLSASSDPASPLFTTYCMAAEIDPEYERRGSDAGFDFGYGYF